ncbi:MAG: nickel-responsive transcriptional regulator NikR [Herminiimonas sp.]|nr:nickel-responsive transcriptional regulator NikR [Herminiimonas sp.]
MRRITISVDDTLAEQFDALIERHGYENRSEAFRDLLRDRIENERKTRNQVRYCVATLSFVYDHHERDLASRMADIQHEHHDLCVSTMHVHLDHESCLETVVLRGLFKDVRAFADKIIAQAGIRHGSVNIVPMEMETASRASHRHHHLHPMT